MSVCEPCIPRIGRHQENNDELKPSREPWFIKPLGVSFPTRSQNTCVSSNYDATGMTHDQFQMMLLKLLLSSCLLVNDVNPISDQELRGSA
jgi:hypothetical protein